jgi:hypothetical protein
MQTIRFDISKSIDELKKSPYHQQLGRNVCAAFVAQQQGTKLDTAWKKIEEPIGDLWLLMAEVIREQCFKATDVQSSVPGSKDRDHTIQ